MTRSTTRPTLRYAADVFSFDRSESLILTAPLSAVLADACKGAEQDDRATIPPGSTL